MIVKDLWKPWADCSSNQTSQICRPTCDVAGHTCNKQIFFYFQCYQDHECESFQDKSMHSAIEGSDRPAHLGGQIRAFAICKRPQQFTTYPQFRLQWFISGSKVTQADLNVNYSDRPKGIFS